MYSFKAQGLVLRRVNYGEADRIITFLTVNHGKISAIAKSVRRMSSRLAGHLELFTEAELQLVKGKNLLIITGAQNKRHFTNLVADYELMRRGFLFLEITDKLTDTDVSKEVYELLIDSLIRLNSGVEPTVAELYFKLNLLRRLGYQPNLEQCLESLNEIRESKRYAFSAEKGGIVELAYALPHHTEIGPDHIKLWRLLLSFKLDKASKVRGIAKPAQESLPVCNDFYDYLFGKRFMSEEL